jgi:hypothetical protein
MTLSLNTGAYIDAMSLLSSTSLITCTGAVFRESRYQQEQYIQLTNETVLLCKLIEQYLYSYHNLHTLHVT